MKTSARDAALARLDRLTLPAWPAGLARQHTPECDDPRDRALAEQSYVGVLKNLTLLQRLSAHFSGRDPKHVEPLVRKILAVALYQLRFLQRVPASAAVDEAVEQTRRFGVRRAAGFVNAVLRRATRDADPELPPTSDAKAHLETALSHPGWMATRLVERFSARTAVGIGQHNNAEPPLIVRLGAGVEPSRLAGATAHEQAGFAVLEGATRDALGALADAGLAQPQDPTAGAVVAALRLRPGMRVLDRCCGVGTKTLQVVEGLGPGAVVVAIDASEPRCAVLRRTLQQRGIDGVQTLAARRMADVSAQPAFDAALVDAPCSNSGVLARRPEARWSHGEASLVALRRIQIDLLRDTADAVAPGGRMVYSTCSIWEEENERVAQEFLAGDGRFLLDDQALTLPSPPGPASGYRDGGYVAVFRKA